MKDFPEIVEFRRRLRTLGHLVTRKPAGEPALSELPPPSFAHDTSDLAPVVSLAEARRAEWATPRRATSAG